MSNERQETVADIVREMRIGDLCAEDTSASRPEYINDFLVSYADRIEVAWKRESEATTEKSSRVGNAAAMREALETISKCDTSKEEDCYTLYRVCEAALSAKPRNCDMLSKDEVLETLKDRSFSKEDTIEWIYSKAKGGAEWMV